MKRPLRVPKNWNRANPGVYSRLPARHHRRLKRLVRQEGTNMSQWIRALLIEYLDYEN